MSDTGFVEIKQSSNIICSYVKWYLISFIEKISEILWRHDRDRASLMSANVRCSTATNRFHPSDHFTPAVQHSIIPAVRQSQDSAGYQFALHYGNKCPSILSVSSARDEHLTTANTKSHPLWTANQTRHSSCKTRSRSVAKIPALSGSQ
jgi:hypothetical protein